MNRSYSREIKFIVKELVVNENMLARKSDISRDTIVKIENCSKSVKYSTLDKIIEAFYVNINWFYNGKADPFIKGY